MTEKVSLLQIFKTWINRYFSDPQAVLLLVLLIVGFGLVIWLGGILAPVLASIVIAYLLEWVVIHLQRLKMPRLSAVIITYLGFLGLFFAAFFLLLPLLWNQVIALFNDLPNMTLRIQKILIELLGQYPDFFSQSQLQTFTGDLLTESRNLAKVMLSLSWSSITGLITWLVYLVLVPLLVFFFLKDRKKMIQWVVGFLPPQRGVLSQVATEVNEQIGNYIRGKVVEIIFVGVVTYLVCWYFSLQYAALLSFLVGISVLIPYVGAIVITIPVVVVAAIQWGFTAQFSYFIIAYLVVQGLDANILVPLLFSEAVNLHPVAIIVATLFFGGIWGFWGVFFAIPLATLVKAVLNAWPKPHAKKEIHPHAHQ